jgi:hypothetical protein
MKKKNLSYAVDVFLQQIGRVFQLLAELAQ